jgi:hypothetical protein
VRVRRRLGHDARRAAAEVGLEVGLDLGVVRGGRRVRGGGAERGRGGRARRRAGRGRRRRRGRRAGAAVDGDRQAARRGAARAREERRGARVDAQPAGRLVAALGLGHAVVLLGPRHLGGGRALRALLVLALLLLVLVLLRPLLRRLLLLLLLLLHARGLLGHCRLQLLGFRRLGLRRGGRRGLGRGGALRALADGRRDCAAGAAEQAAAAALLDRRGCGLRGRGGGRERDCGGRGGRRRRAGRRRRPQLGLAVGRGRVLSSRRRPRGGRLCRCGGRLVELGAGVVDLAAAKAKAVERRSTQGRLAMGGARHPRGRPGGATGRSRRPGVATAPAPGPSPPPAPRRTSPRSLLLLRLPSARGVPLRDAEGVLGGGGGVEARSTWGQGGRLSRPRWRARGGDGCHGPASPSRHQHPQARHPGPSQAPAGAARRHQSVAPRTLGLPPGECGALRRRKRPPFSGVGGIAAVLEGRGRGAGGAGRGAISVGDAALGAGGESAAAAAPHGSWRPGARRPAMRGRGRHCGPRATNRDRGRPQRGPLPVAGGRRLRPGLAAG